MREDTKSMKVQQRIWMQKLLLARRIMTKENSLAKAVNQQHKKRSWPGLYNEVEDV